mmetsp:Transcript_54029/g.128401  ORF Transcript_54029/g.128401 Transcript_54029/m.128401 type:complete len:242 (+) Transcript_54029:192-917(+)
MPALRHHLTVRGRGMRRAGGRDVRRVLRRRFDRTRARRRLPRALRPQLPNPDRQVLSPGSLRLRGHRDRLRAPRGVPQALVQGGSTALDRRHRPVYRERAQGEGHTRGSLPGSDHPAVAPPLQRRGARVHGANDPGRLGRLGRLRRRRPVPPRGDHDCEPRPPVLPIRPLLQGSVSGGVRARAAPRQQEGGHRRGGERGHVRRRPRHPREAREPARRGPHPGSAPSPRPKVRGGAALRDHP